MSIELWAIVIGVAVSVAVYALESRRERTARRDEYRADVCAAIAERTATLERQLAATISEGAGSWEPMHPLLDEFSQTVGGLLPRARVAKLDAAVIHLREVLSTFLGKWAIAQGQAKSDMDLAADVRAALTDGTVSPHEMGPELTRLMEPADDEWRQYQGELLRALRNHLTVLRRGLEDHVVADAYAPPPPTWPAPFTGSLRSQGQA